MEMNWRLRLAVEEDVPVLEELIPLSARGLQRGYYSDGQIEAALGTVFAVDRQLIRDGTYYVAESAAQLIGCGGWSRRRSLCGGDAGRTCGEDEPLDPACDAARIRAFFVHPGWARQGIGRAIIKVCEAAIKSAGFSSVELAATLAGEPLYLSCGYAVASRYGVPLPDGTELPVVRMTREL